MYITDAPLRTNTKTTRKPQTLLLSGCACIPRASTSIDLAPSDPESRKKGKMLAIVGTI